VPSLRTTLLEAEIFFSLASCTPGGALSLLVTVQVLVWPLPMEPEQSAEKLAV
jgi:hypothetical protein